MYSIENGHWTVGRQLGIFQYILLAGVFLTTISMMITYIVRIRSRMSYLVVENINLLNKMNEGLVVIDNNDRSLKFANIPAV